MSTIDKVQYLYKYNTDDDSFPILTIVYIVIFIIVIFIYYARTVISQYNLEWKNIRCNPKHIFYSGFLEPNTLDPFTATYENLKKCIIAETGLRTPKITNIFSMVDNSHKNNIDTIKQLDNYVKVIPDNTKSILEKIDSSYNSINNSIEEKEIKMTYLFYYQTKIYNAIRLYIERIFKILDLLKIYSKDMLLYSLSKDKLDLNVASADIFGDPIQLDDFIVNKLIEYNSILIEDGEDNTTKSYEELYEEYQQTTNSTTTDYSEQYRQAVYLEDRIKDLIMSLNKFKDANKPKLGNINKKCKLLSNQDKTFSYRTIFPQLTLPI